MCVQILCSVIQIVSVHLTYINMISIILSILSVVAVPILCATGPTSTELSADPQITLGPFRIINFSGRSWWVRGTRNKANPGQNYFGNMKENVEIDDNGYLHLRIVKQGDLWVSSQINSLERFGYGTFSFVLGSGFDTVDLKAGVGLFIYANDTNQIDLEISEWGFKSSNNSYYVIQPINSTAKRVSKSFDLNYSAGPVVSAITLTPKYVLFQSFNASSIKQIESELGQKSASPLLLNQEYYDGPNIPLGKGLVASMNYWLHFQNKSELFRSPLSGMPSEVVVREFAFKEYIDQPLP